MMGEAKRRAAAKANEPQCDFAAVAKAVCRFFAACSDAQGVDCYGYAVHGQRLLARLGVSADIAVGYAAWRVGNADHNVVAHHPHPNTSGVTLGGAAAMTYHAWLMVEGRILDLTTHQLRRKAAMLDASDGYRTVVEWCPDYLLADSCRVASFEQVVRGRAGLFHYERVPALEALARATALPPDEEDMAVVWLIYQNPESAFVGPMQVN
jgi:hypothetical protein